MILFLYLILFSYKLVIIYLIKMLFQISSDKSIFFFSVYQTFVIETCISLINTVNHPTLLLCFIDMRLIRKSFIFKPVKKWMYFTSQIMQYRYWFLILLTICWNARITIFKHWVLYDLYLLLFFLWLNAILKMHCFNLKNSLKNNFSIIIIQG